MTTHSTEMDLFDSAEKARQGVSGKSLPNALVSLVFITGLFVPKELLKEIQELSSKFPMQYLMSISVTDRAGRTVDVIPALLSPKNSTERENAERFHMMRQAQLSYSVIGSGGIEPARMIIWEQHYIFPESLWPFVEQSFFVPEGHERLFSKAISAGLEGDYATALHILVPQLENALRELLKCQGHLINTKEKDDNITQEAITLSNILAHEAIAEELGENMHFTLEALLSDKLGLGIRHNIANGFDGDASYQGGGTTAYIFWLILRLVILPLMSAGQVNN